MDTSGVDIRTSFPVAGYRDLEREICKFAGRIAQLALRMGRT